VLNELLCYVMETREQQQHQRIDENGRCTLHPGIQLLHIKRNGEVRVLLSACPLCVSGLPATGQPIRIRRAATSSSDMSTSASTEGGGRRQQQSVAEEAVIFATGSGGGKEGGDKGTEKKHDSMGDGDFEEGMTTPGGERPTPTSPPRPRARARPRTPSPQTPLLHRMKLLQLDGQEIGGGGGQQYQQDQGNNRRLMNNRQQNQQDLLHSSMDGSAAGPNESAAGPRSRITHTGTEDNSSQGNMTADEDEFEEAHAERSRSVYEQDHMQLPFKRGMNGVQHGARLSEAFAQSSHSQPRHQNLYHHIPLPHSTPQQAQQAKQSHTFRSLPSKSPPILRAGGGEGGMTVRRTPETSPRRPDPEDTDEFNEKYLGGGFDQYRQQEQASHLYSNHPRTAPTSSSYLLNRGGFPDQRHEQPQYISDEVSVMSMSSVAGNMRKNQQRQHEEQQQQQWHQQKYQASDANDNHSYSEASKDSHHLSPTASNSKSSTTVQKPMSSPSSSPTSSSSSSSDDVIAVEKEEKITDFKKKEDDGGIGSIIDTFDYDERGWCRNHPSTVRLRKKKMFSSAWQVVLSSCPECCLDEMRRIQRLGVKKTASRNSSRMSKSSSKGDGASLSGVSKSSRSSASKASSDKKKEEKKKKKVKNPPISQLSLHSRSVENDGKEGSDKYDDTRSVGTASTITMSTYTHSSVGGRWQNQQDYGSDGGAIAFVTRMPYTDMNGERGWYTGQVESSTGTPHGIGTMNYANGLVVYEGVWNNGVNIRGDAREGEGIMLVGGTTSLRQHHVTPRTLQEGKRSHLATLNEDGKSINYEYADSSSSRDDASGSRLPSSDLPQQQQQRTVVCGMSWTDLNGDDGVYTGEVNNYQNPDGMGSMRYDYGMVVEGMWQDGTFIYSDEDDSNSENDDDFGRNHEESIPSLYSSA